MNGNLEFIKTKITCHNNNDSVTTTAMIIVLVVSFLSTKN